MPTPRRALLLFVVLAAFVLLPSSGATNSPNMRIDYSLIDTARDTHSDIAFWGNIGVAGNYDGFRVFNTDSHQLITSYLCRGPQNDVSLWQNGSQLLLIQSVDRPQLNGETVCSQNHASDTTACGTACFEGIRIFDLTNPAAPVYLKGVYTDCGSHTHTLIPDLANNRLLVYVMSYPAGTGPLCQVPFGKFSIVEIPLANPQGSSVIAQPPIVGPDPYFGVGCHDITVFLAIHKAAASCQTEGQIWDITDPANPDTLHPLLRVDAPGVNFWHSAEFTWDGQYVTFNDEGGGTCQPNGDGKIRTYRVSDGQLMSTYMIPRPQSTYCSVHNGMYIPVAGRYLLVAAWYGGGTSVIDLTDPTTPHEIAYYRADGNPRASDAWSSYWYNGKIYANDIGRGQDVFDLLSSTNQFGATFTHLNAQTQEGLIAGTPPNISRRALTGRRARQGHRMLVTARARGWLSPARG